MGAKNKGQKEDKQHHQQYPQACVDAATKYWLGLDVSHQYAFKGSNAKLFNQMAANDAVKQQANIVFGGSAPTSTTDGQTTDGQPIHYVVEPTYTCP